MIGIPISGIRSPGNSILFDAGDLYLRINVMASLAIDPQKKKNKKTDKNVIWKP